MLVKNEFVGNLIFLSWKDLVFGAKYIFMAYSWKLENSDWSEQTHFPQCLSDFSLSLCLNTLSLRFADCCETKTSLRRPMRCYMSHVVVWWSAQTIWAILLDSLGDA